MAFKLLSITVIQDNWKKVYKVRHICKYLNKLEIILISSSFGIKKLEFLFEDKFFWTWIESEVSFIFSYFHRSFSLISCPLQGHSYLTLINPCFLYVKNEFVWYYILQACLPTGSDSYAGLKAIVTGWGTTSSGGNLSSKLREVTVDVCILFFTRRIICQKVWQQ